MKNWTPPQRFINYIVHLGLSLGIPMLLAILTIAIMGSREAAGIGIGIGLLVLNILYSFYFIKASLLITIISGIVVTLISTGSTFLGMKLKINPSFDFYGIYTGLFCYGLSSVLSWEIIYRIVLRLHK